jgi:hypothetical protein
MKRGMWDVERRAWDSRVGLAVVEAGGLVERARNLRGGWFAPWGASGQVIQLVVG